MLAASDDTFSESGPATLVGEVPGLEEVLGLKIAWMAFIGSYSTHLSCPGKSSVERP